jgi:nucleoside-diphosphate-sugar epimerase
MLGIIGASGFIGANLSEMFPDARPITRVDLQNGIDTFFECVYVAAPSATKWQIDQEPQVDLENIESLVERICLLNTHKVVYFSTIDVFERPGNSSENSQRKHSLDYGGNRSRMEDLLFNQLDNVLIRRLSGLYGRYLKKNLLFDLKNGRLDQLGSYHPDSQYQYLDVKEALRIATSIDFAELNLLNIVAEPISVTEICGKSITWLSRANSRHIYNVTTEHRDSGYFFDKNYVLKSIFNFLNLTGSR